MSSSSVTFVAKKNEQAACRMFRCVLTRFVQACDTFGAPSTVAFTLRPSFVLSGGLPRARGRFRCCDTDRARGAGMAAPLLNSAGSPLMNRRVAKIWGRILRAKQRHRSSTSTNTGPQTLSVLYQN